MKQPEDIHAAKERFAKLAQSYDPQEHVKEHPLEPFIENIRMLRESGATYKTVNGMLAEIGVEVCVTTVARFCQARLLNPPKKRPTRKRPKRKRKNYEGAAENTSDEQVETISETPNKSVSETKKKPSGSTQERVEQELGKRRREPRIADPKNI